MTLADVHRWLDDSPGGYLVTSLEGRIRWTNRTLASWVGASGIELAGRQLHELLTPGGSIHYEAITPSLVLGARLDSVPLDIRRSDGATLHLLCNVSIRAGDNEQIIGSADAGETEVRWVCVDVTGRHAHERDLLVAQRRLGRLQELSAAFAIASTEEEVCAALLAQLVDGVKAEAGVLALLDDEGNPFVAASRSMNQRDGSAMIGSGDHLSLDFALDSSAVFKADSESATNVLPTRQVATIPLQATDARLGALRLQLTREEPYADDERSLLIAAASMSAQALERTRLLARHRRDAERNAALSALMHRIEESTSRAERAQVIVDFIVPDHADYATVEIPSLGPAPVGLRHRDPTQEPRLRDLRTAVAIDADYPYSLAAGRERQQPQLMATIDESVYDQYDLEEDQLEALRALAPTSYLGLPLVARNQVIGSMLLAHSTSQRRFDNEDVTYYQRMADACALALDNARLYEHERDTARLLQNAILPQVLPQDPRFQIATFYEAGHELNQIGGDWFDAFLIEKNRIGVAVGDVVGGGIRSATTMARLHTALHAYALEGTGVSDTLERLNVYAAAIPGAFASSAAYAEIDLATNRLTYASAGHPPPVLITPGRLPRLLWDARNTLLGVDGAPFEDASLQLEPGSTILFYTDGLVERRGQSIDDGLRLLIKLITERESGPVCPEVLAHMMDTTQHGDDACVVALTISAG